MPAASVRMDPVQTIADWVKIGISHRQKAIIIFHVKNKTSFTKTDIRYFKVAKEIGITLTRKRKKDHKIEES